MAKTGAQRQREWRARQNADERLRAKMLQNQRVRMRWLRRERYAQACFDHGEKWGELLGWEDFRHAHPPPGPWRFSRYAHGLSTGSKSTPRESSCTYPRPNAVPVQAPRRKRPACGRRGQLVLWRVSPDYYRWLPAHLPVSVLEKRLGRSLCAFEVQRRDRYASEARRELEASLAAERARKKALGPSWSDGRPIRSKTVYGQDSPPEPDTRGLLGSVMASIASKVRGNRPRSIAPERHAAYKNAHAHRTNPRPSRLCPGRERFRPP